MKIGIGNDHSALALKAEIVEFLKVKGHEVVDYGTYTTDSCDCPDVWRESGPCSCSRRSREGDFDLRNRTWNLSRS